MKVRKAVFPAAGLGTRFLPATKASAQRNASAGRQAHHSIWRGRGIGRGLATRSSSSPAAASAIEDHFDVSYELEQCSKSAARPICSNIVRKISDMIHVAYRPPEGGLWAWAMPF